MSVPFNFKPDSYRTDAIHVSVDLETASTSDNAAIVQLACVVVGSDYKKNVFSRYISLASCEQHGMEVSVETMKYWDGQDPELRKQVFGGTTKIQYVLGAWLEWLREISEGDLDRIYLWGNGADFDCTILRNAYEIFDKWPLDFRKHEHLRTLKRGMPVDWQQLAHERFMQEFGLVAVPHNAIWDAIYQGFTIEHGLEYQRQCKAIMDDLA